jgi:hypothetical protein
MVAVLRITVILKATVAERYENLRCIPLGVGQASLWKDEGVMNLNTAWY